MATQIINPEMDVLISSAEQLKADIQSLHTPLAAMPAGITELQERALAAYATDTASGAIANFPDGADDIPVKSATFAIDPQQDLNGYDAPWPAGGGKNKLPNTLEDGVSSGVTFKTNADGTISASGTTQASSVYRPLCSNFALTPSTSYILNGNSGNAQIRIREYDSGGNLLATTTTSSSAESTFTANASTDHCDAYLIAYGNIGSTVNLTYKPMLRLSTVSDATFSPYSNICPISGWTGANIYTKGENLFEPVNVTGTNNGVTFAWVNGICTVTGTATALAINGPTSRTLPAGTYTVINFNRTAGTGAFVSDTSVSPWATIANTLTHTDESGNGWDTFTLTKTITLAIRARVNSGVTVDGAVITPMIVSGTVRPSEYAAYTSKAQTITWSEAGTVYGGTLEYLGGENWRLTRTHGYVDLGTLNWTRAAFASGKYGHLAYVTGIKPVANPNVAADLKCSNYKTLAGNLVYSGHIGISMWSTEARISIYDSTMEDLSASDFKAAMNGVQLVYPLATPETYDLTADELRTLLGTNNIWSDTGDAEAEYRADTALYIAKKIAEAQA